MVDGIEGIKISQGLALGLGDFDLIRVIGRGSYAKVLLVRLKKNEQIYAMKVVKKELVHDDEVRGRRRRRGRGMEGKRGRERETGRGGKGRQRDGSVEQAGKSQWTFSGEIGRREDLGAEKETEKKMRRSEVGMSKQKGDEGEKDGVKSH